MVELGSKKWKSDEGEKTEQAEQLHREDRNFKMAMMERQTALMARLIGGQLIMPQQLHASFKYLQAPPDKHYRGTS